MRLASENGKRMDGIRWMVMEACQGLFWFLGEKRRYLADSTKLSF
jgi:hypothetical protein